MRHEFRLADIGEGLEEAEIISWLVAIGDSVERDQPLIEVMTDKSNAELPAPERGTVVALGGNVGDIINVGELIAVIETADPPDSTDSTASAASTASTASDSTGLPESSPVAAIVAPAAPLQAVSPAASTPAPAVSPAPRVSPVVSAASIELQGVADPAPSSDPITPRTKASPATRRAAAERGIDLRAVQGTGPGGRILLTDLDAPLAATPPATPQVTPQATPPLVVSPPTVDDTADTPDATPTALPTGTIPLRGIRRAVANHMTRSWSEIPHIHAFEHIDAEPLLKVRSRLRDTGRAAYESLTPLSFFVAAVASALRSHPEANASINMADETITYHPAVNVGVAVASENGLIVPVLQAADQLDFATLSLTLTQLVRGAREAQLSREHFLGGTVTITNFGALGGEQAAPLIRPPEALILGFGSIAERPFVIDGEVVARKTMHIVAGADHRLLDGDVVTSVLASIASALSDPLELVI